MSPASARAELNSAAAPSRCWLVSCIALLASTLEQRDGRLTGRYASLQCTGEEKVRRIRTTFDLSAFSRLYAYGDTVEDLPMLALADEVVYRGQPMPQCSRVGSDNA